MSDSPNHSAKGWRMRRVGEIIAAGDLMPAGPAWEPVKPYLVGYEVLGRRDGCEDLIMTPRKRRHSAAQVAKILARRAIGA